MDYRKMTGDEFELEMRKKYPLMLEDLHGSPSATCMAFGLEVGPGWHNILDELFSKLEPISRKLKETREDGSYPKLAQVKEKFAALRVYLTWNPDEMDQAIEEAEAKSGVTCEQCGEPGTIRGDWWLKCLCDECDKK